jgi:F-type H+-transporting ATPase subunit b
MIRKLSFTLALTVAVFLAAFAAGFLTLGLGRALAQPAPAETPGAPGEPTKDAPVLDDKDAANMGTAQGAAGDDIRKDGHGTSPTQHSDGHHGHHDPSVDFRFVGPPFGHGTMDVKGGKYGDGEMTDPHTGVTTKGEEPMSAPFIYMVLNFALLLIILLKYGGPAAKKSAVDRHEQIKTALDEAAKLRKQAADKLAEYETRLGDADNEIKKLVEGLRADAEADKQRILGNAERQAAQMKKDAEQRIAAEIEYARARLTREVTAAASAATEKLLRAKMTPGDQQKLVSTFISDIQAGPTSGQKGVR